MANPRERITAEEREKRIRDFEPHIDDVLEHGIRLLALEAGLFQKEAEALLRGNYEEAELAARHARQVMDAYVRGYRIMRNMQKLVELAKEPNSDEEPASVT